MSRDNYGPGSFADQYDNNKMRSMDRDQRIGGVTGTPFEDEFDLDIDNFTPRHGEAYYYPHKRMEPSRAIDIGPRASGNYRNLDLPDYSGHGPKNWKISDEKLKEKVCEILLKSSEVDATELEVEVEDRVVTLKGFIANRGMKNVAEDLIASIPGIEDVFSEVRYHETSNFQIIQKEGGH